MTETTAAMPGAIMGVLARELSVRVLNCSPSGCLLETTAPMEVGTVGSLQLDIEGRAVVDHFMVVRCQAIAGAGALYHVGARFLWIGPMTGDTVRQAIGQPASSGVPAPPAG
jgi:hypothetical protein